ncbi:hypothetical protein [Brachybacterium sp. YJGR34]|uniref:hypothetical protein n=1 Tax=Brachybacterium sp. YJGR34 TaxID=2059911 RepID=UPI000E0B1D4F|nr:hypothetical protein [Brachybacterium sp. YJGR34]
MRHVGMTLLGLLGGLLAGIVLQDLLAGVFVHGGEVTTPGLVVLPVLLPLCGIVGAVIALVASLRGDGRFRR